MKIGMLCVCGVLAAGVVPGCSLFQSACAEATVLVDGAMVHIWDASAAVDQAEARFMILPLEERVIGLRMVERARLALRAAQESLLAAKSACTSPNLVDVFKDFLEAWRAIELVFKGTGAEVAAPSIVGVVGRCGGPCQVRKQ